MLPNNDKSSTNYRLQAEHTTAPSAARNRDEIHFRLPQDNVTVTMVDANKVDIT